MVTISSPSFENEMSSFHLYSPNKFFTEDPICASKLKSGWLVVSMGGGDIHELVQVVARGIYPRCEEELHRDPEEGFKIVQLLPNLVKIIYFLSF